MIRSYLRKGSGNTYDQHAIPVGKQKTHKSARRHSTMIGILAKFFRGLHLFVGITAPPPGHNERAFVLTWLGMSAFVVALSVLLFYLIVKMYIF